MNKEKIILFCSSGKTYGHFLKTHALYLAAKEQFTCLEAINPTKFTTPFRNDNTEEALKSLEMILGKKFEEMKKRGNLPAELWDIFRE